MQCRSCGGADLSDVLDLGQHAWCNNFLRPDQLGSEPRYPLELVYCNNCTLTQLNYTVSKEVMFSEHTYVSGTTNTLRKHFYVIAKYNIAHMPSLQTDSLIVDIGGNDGTQLQQYQQLGYTNVLNVESAHNIATLARRNKVPTDTAFFNEKYVDDNLGCGKAMIINASGVFFHLEELQSVIRGIKKLLHQRGIVVIQFMYLGDMINKCTYDGIYHEHLCYYSVQSLQNLLKPHGLTICDSFHSTIHGGSIIAYVSHDDSYPITQQHHNVLKRDKTIVTFNELQRLARNTVRHKHNLQHIISTYKQLDYNIIGIGAPAKGNTLLTYGHFDADAISYIVETNPLKYGLYTPVTHIPIVSEADNVVFSRPTKGLLLSWNFANEITDKLKNIKHLSFINPFDMRKK